MVTVLREDGLRIVIFSNDHVPAHVHVFGDGEAKIDIVGENAADLVWAVNMTRGEIRRSLRVVQENLSFLRRKWEDIHGKAE